MVPYAGKPSLALMRESSEVRSVEEMRKGVDTRADNSFSVNNVMEDSRGNVLTNLYEKKKGKRRLEDEEHGRIKQKPSHYSWLLWHSGISGM